MEPEKKGSERSDLSHRELREEEGEEVIDRETTSFVNAQHIVEDAEAQRRQRGEK